MKNEVLKIEGLSKNFGKLRVLDNVSFNVNYGDLIGFVGVNGCGKTTTFKCIAGMLNHKGNINMFDLTKKNRSKMFCDLLYLFDKETYFPEMSGYKTLELFAHAYGIFNKEIVLSAMKDSGLLGREFEAVKGYSLGMKQRLNIAKILLVKPSIVLMDEPFNGIDLAGVEDMIALIKRLNKDQQTAFVISSHQIGELEKFCNRLIVMDNHKIVTDRYISENLYAFVSLKLSDGNQLSLLCEKFDYVNSLNDVHYFKIEKGFENSILEFMHKNKINYLYYNAENSIKNELMRVFKGGI